VYLIFNSVSVLLAIPAGKFSDKMGVNAADCGFAIYSVVYFGFGWFNQFWMFICLFMLYGVYSALTDSAQKAMVSDLVSPELKGTGFGIYHSVLGLTLLPASLIGGYLYDHVSPSAPFYFGATMSFWALLGLLIFIVIHKHK
jgi:MFS family permease